MTDTKDNMMQWEEDTQKNKFLTFILGDETYGLEIKYVTEIIGFQEFTRMPELPDYVRGIINLRGKIIPIMDVRLRFKKEPKVYTDRTCIIIVDIKEISIGLIVDGVSEVLTIKDEEIVDPPSLGKDFNHRFIKNIGKAENGIKLLLDCEKLLAEEELETLVQAI